MHTVFRIDLQVFSLSLCISHNIVINSLMNKFHIYYEPFPLLMFWKVKWILFCLYWFLNENIEKGNFFNYCDEDIFVVKTLILTKLKEFRICNLKSCLNTLPLFIVEFNWGKNFLTKIIVFQHKKIQNQCCKFILVNIQLDFL